MYGAANPDSLNSRFIFMDSESAYTYEEVLGFDAQRGYKIEFRPLGTNTQRVYLKEWSDW